MSLSTIATLVVAALHVGFFVLESVLWTTPTVRRVFGTTEEEAHATRVLALNQGVYNLGVAGLLVGFLATDTPMGTQGVLLFVIAMGAVGAATANWRILWIQSLPALVALVLLLAG
jgi:putative membrane protein